MSRPSFPFPETNTFQFPQTDPHMDDQLILDKGESEFNHRSIIILEMIFELMHNHLKRVNIYITPYVQQVT